MRCCAGGCNRRGTSAGPAGADRTAGHTADYGDAGAPHTQPAQPTTLAHYLLGAVEFRAGLGASSRGLATNQPQSLGACPLLDDWFFRFALDYTARLLGFDGLAGEFLLSDRGD